MLIRYLISFLIGEDLLSEELVYEVLYRIGRHKYLLKNQPDEKTWCNSVMKMLEAHMCSCTDTKNKKWLSYYQTLYQIVSLLEQYEQKEKFKDLFYVFFPTLRLFFDQLKKGLKKIDDFSESNEDDYSKKYTLKQQIEKSVSEFIDNMELLIHHMGISCANILNSDGRNGLAYDVPIRLCLMYLSALYEITKVLNNTEYQYRFSLAPLTYSRPNTKIFEFGLEPEDRLIQVRLARHQLYSPRALLAILTHEGGHYIGGEDSRLREKRKQEYVYIASVIVIENLLPDESLERVLSCSDLQKCNCRLIWKDWGQRKEKMMRDFCSVMQRELKGYNADRAHQYHFADLYDDICCIIKNVFLYDPQNKMVKYINTMDRELCLQLQKSKPSECSRILHVIEEENKILSENMLRAALADDIYDALKFVKEVMKEAYADLGAVLVLELNPNEYMEAYLLSEGCNPNSDEINDILINRVAMVHMLASSSHEWKAGWKDTVEREWDECERTIKSI